MRALLQRVSAASVRIDEQETARIGPGLLVLLGVAASDTTADADRLARKTAGLRIFADAEKPMNRSVLDIGGEVLVVSQFTLVAQTDKGMRPGFSSAAPPEQAEPLYERYVRALGDALAGATIATGQFGADMQVSLVNDGPVTLLLE